MVLAAASLLTGLCLPSQSRADVVYPGYDLFTTVEGGTMFEGINFQGVPLNTFNFGGSIGTLGVGNTDTIVQRLAPAVTVPGTFSLQMDALQLESVVPMFPGNTYGFITLDSSQASTGTMDINAGTFSSSLNVYFDVRAGSLGGPIVATGALALTSTDVAWSHNAPPGALLIPGVNYDLNGVNTSADFWPGQFTEIEPGARHEVDPAAVPEPTTMIAGALLLLPFGSGAVRQLRKKLQAT
jgi:hypothetical protein